MAAACKTGRGAGRHQHLAIEIVDKAVVALLLGRDGLAQPRNAVATRVDILPVAHGLGGRGLNHRGHRRIAHALRQVDAAHAIALRGHGADFGLKRFGRECAEGKAR
jgi:hypothetical protein